MSDSTGWEDFKDPDEISNEELALRLKEDTDIENWVNEVGEELVKELNIIATEDRPVDRFGTCPHCKVSWDGGDIYEQLLKKSALSVNLGDAKKAAIMYGWTELDKKHFSTLLTYELEEGIFVQCPDCSHLFDVDTSKEYPSLYDLKLELRGLKTKA